jgi:hypothetical protein
MIGIEVQQQVLDFGARKTGVAIEAHDLVDAAVQFEHLAAAGPFVQAIDVLRHQGQQVAGLLQPRQRQMGGIGLRAGHGGVADHAARPITLAHGFEAAKFRTLGGRRATPHAIAAAVIGNAGGGADAGARQHENAPVGVKKIGQRIAGMIEVRYDKWSGFFFGYILHGMAVELSVWIV